MKEFFDLLLLTFWRRGGALGIMFAGIICALPAVILLSWISDPPSPAHEISAAAKESWTGRVAGFRYDPTRGLIVRVAGSAGEVDVMFSGIETPLCDHRTPLEALKWLRSRVPMGTAVKLHVLELAEPLFPERGHLVVGNEWLNGSLVEQGLAKLTRPSPMEEYNAGRGALRSLQADAQAHQRGLWRRNQ